MYVRVRVGCNNVIFLSAAEGRPDVTLVSFQNKFIRVERTNVVTQKSKIAAYFRVKLIARYKILVMFYINVDLDLYKYYKLKHDSSHRLPLYESWKSIRTVAFQFIVFI